MKTLMTRRFKINEYTKIIDKKIITGLAPASLKTLAVGANKSMGSKIKNTIARAVFNLISSDS